jgi:hypothetical protein
MVVAEGEIGTSRGCAIVPAAEDYFVFARYLDIVIPGRREATSPESITTIGSMDSGLAPSRAFPE